MESSQAATLPIERIRGVGPQRAKLLGRLGITTIYDALLYLPCRYEDRSSFARICDLRESERETIRGRVVSARVRPLRRGLRIFDLTVNDGSGLLAASWFNQPFLKRNFSPGQEVILSGRVTRGASRAGLVMESPDYEIVDDQDDCIHSNRIVPLYRLTEGIGQKQLRRLLYTIVTEYAGSVVDHLPEDLLRRNGLPPLGLSIRELHFPSDDSDIDALNNGTTPHRRRLAFDELFFFEAGMALRRNSCQRESGLAMKGTAALTGALFQRLPFALTGAQRRVIADILADMAAPHPMHRLVQGDVGCGKTVVAVAAMLTAVESGYQAALMAPTEILAEQHYRSVQSLLEGLGVECELVTSGSRQRCRFDAIAAGDIPLVIGTHALIHEGVRFGMLGLAVIDEQHKFGVAQRAVLRKKGRHPDVLVMTATPIPRSLALTMYGDLDCSVIDELPPNRRPVHTVLHMADEKERIYGLLEREIAAGRQAYVVYPAIEESETGSVRAAVQGREAFARIFPTFRTGLLHGRMPAGEKEEVMTDFKAGKIDLLVSTTVIEVGVDVPNATVMLIVHAERFGLAQLHQLRGRVGRGAEASHCLLIAYEPLGEDARRRLSVMTGTTDGFRIAEEDLAIRGPGEVFGVRQAGMPDFRVADPLRDQELLETARSEAFALVDADPALAGCAPLRQALEVFWQGKIELLKTG